MHYERINSSSGTRHRLRVSHEAIRNVLEKQKYSSGEAGKKPLLLAHNLENRLQFATEHFSLPPQFHPGPLKQYNRKRFCTDSIKLT